MKKINFLALSIVFTGLITLSSCSKEKKIEKNLWKKGGEWNIESFNVKQTSTYASDNFEESYANVGTYTFNENGTGTVKLIIDEFIETSSFTYTNTENQLMITIDNETQYYNLIEWEKDNMKIVYAENFYEGVDGNLGSGVYKETITLKKK
ncbi:MAG: hypothetical protein EBQ94_03230 [Flavobacteriales bacterium]|nr:hypothetical protein [Crocinitomicaceae bacterium]NBX79382.1 hypothetical protein [Flavobacteriales bacterium]NCA20597.1 hypothetical protein [Crocinitomicaceae bacterium]